MNTPRPILIDATGKRRFDCFPAAVLVFVVNQDEQILMLANPKAMVHAYTHHYDERVTGGVVRPGSDMAGSQIGWFGLDALPDLSVIVPRQAWLVTRAVELYRLWHNADIPPLEKAPDQHGGVKYAKTFPDPD